MAALRKLPPKIRWFTAGVAIVAATMAAVAIWIAVWGEPFGEWGWSILTFILVAAEALIFGAMAAANGPYESRLRRWDTSDFAQDAYATQFRMDLAASEQQPPRRLFIDSRFLLMAIPPLVAAIVLGVVLSQSGDAGENPSVSDSRALTIAGAAVRTTAARDRIPHLSQLDLLSVSEAAPQLPNTPELETVPPEQLIYVVSYALDDKTSDRQSLRPGPTVVIDADSGDIITIIESE